MLDQIVTPSIALRLEESDNEANGVSEKDEREPEAGCGPRAELAGRPSETGGSPRDPQRRVPRDSLKILRILKEDGFAETRLVELQGEKWVHKIFRFRFWWGRAFRPLARWSMRREQAMCRHLSGIEGVAGEVLPVDECSFLRRWVEGKDLKECRRRGEKPSSAFFDELGRVLSRIHARGAAYVDLAKQDNVIVTRDGKPVLIDFQVSARRREGRSRLLRALSAWWIGRLQREDLRHLAKMKWHVLRGGLSPQEEALIRRKSVFIRLYDVVFAVPFHAVARIFYPKGSNETFRFRRRGKREPRDPSRPA